ncbi:conserved hypothetical protein [Anaeromyxobacter dehalogenans 2CP-1]|uniref:Uncharacterized protein n=1 Tax=Anaeromyxobacter dehalogenans (strain ATCC BAA-258 / DSM 21875 / 2CP-1) TaxID=455488 RepID=B8JAF8_ANAD2|nr:hypothetical protein [Anaeromyxobacter dehalogenans]ACL65677.1 conserved hypothetical protein [Anaeromyxobacter dehalogenans 2CP-1]
MLPEPVLPEVEVSLEPLPVVLELPVPMLPLPVLVPVRSSRSVVDEPDVVEPPVAPCALAGCAATSSPAMPRPATVPHPKYLIGSPSLLWFGARRLPWLSCWLSIG